MRILPDSKITNALKCPICNSTVDILGNSLVCHGVRRHCYDFSASGYVNLMTAGHSDSGDSKAAVAARKAFLSLDYYLPCAKALADTVEEYVNKTDALIADAGCGEGYYTVEIGKKGYRVMGLDLSKHAVDAAAKKASAKGLCAGFFSVGSVFDMPYADKSLDCIVNVFAPCAEKEFFRVLKDGGYLIVMHAGREHLMGLKATIYENVRENDERHDLPISMELLEERCVAFDITVKGSENLQNLFAMTPYYWKTSKEDSEKLKGIDSLNTKVEMIISVYRKTTL